MNYFGTDGIRGHYGGKLLNDDFAYSLGCALGGYLNASGPDPSVLLARDTRPSGEKLMVALSQGLENSGCRAMDAGILPTPALLFQYLQLQQYHGHAPLEPPPLLLARWREPLPARTGPSPQ